MKRTNMFKALATILAVAMIIAMVPMAAMAANTTSADVTYADGKATVKGSIDADAELTMIVVRTEEEITSLDYFTSDADLENAIMYIDQITATANAEKTWSFELRNTADGNVLTAFVGGTDASVAMDSYVIPKAAPVIAYSGEATIFDDQDIVFDVTGGSEDWANAATVYVNGEVYDNSSVAADSITLTDVTANITAIKVVVAGYEDAPWAGTINVLNRYAEAKKAVESATIEYVEESDKAIITVPADKTDAATGADIAYTVTVGGEAATVTEGKVEVTRNADNGDENNDTIAVVITATITKDGSSLGDAVEQTINVNEMGADGPSIAVEEVAFATDAEGAVVVDAYVDFVGEGYSIVVIDTAEAIDPSTQVVKVGGTALIYNPIRGIFVGAVKGYADASAAHAAITVEDVEGGTEVFYYGKDPDAEPGFEQEFDAVDFGFVKKLALGKIAEPSIANLIAADIAEGVMDGYVDASDFAAVKKAALGATNIDINTAE